MFRFSYITVEIEINRKIAGKDTHEKWEQMQGAINVQIDGCAKWKKRVALEPNKNKCTRVHQEFNLHFVSDESSFFLKFSLRSFASICFVYMFIGLIS